VEIDHVLIRVADLDAASHALDSEHGLTSVPGDPPDPGPRARARSTGRTGPWAPPVDARAREAEVGIGSTMRCESVNGPLRFALADILAAKLGHQVRILRFSASRSSRLIEATSRGSTDGASSTGCRSCRP